MKLGFIGTGNMAGAIMGGVIKSNVFKPEEIIGADLFAPGREKVKELYGINVTDSNKEVIEKSEVVIFSVKPQFYADVIQEVKDLLTRTLTCSAVRLRLLPGTSIMNPAKSGFASFTASISSLQVRPQIFNFAILFHSFSLIFYFPTILSAHCTS